MSEGLFFFVRFYRIYIFSYIVLNIRSGSSSRNSTGITANKRSNTDSGKTTDYAAYTPAYNSSLGTEYGSGSSTS